MWDATNRQARDFQHQNLIVNRVGLYREDIRDLAGLTTSKVNTYLMLNTLQLGFIVTFVWAYDRSGPPGGACPMETQADRALVCDGFLECLCSSSPRSGFR